MKKSAQQKAEEAVRKAKKQIRMNKTKNWRGEFDKIVNKIFVVNTKHQAFTTEQWNEEIAPLFRELWKQIKKARIKGYMNAYKNLKSTGVIADEIKKAKQEGRKKVLEEMGISVHKMEIVNEIKVLEIISKLKPKSKTYKK